MHDATQLVARISEKAELVGKEVVNEFEPKIEPELEKSRNNFEDALSPLLCSSLLSLLHLIILYKMKPNLGENWHGTRKIVRKLDRDFALSDYWPSYLKITQ